MLQRPRGAYASLSRSVSLKYLKHKKIKFDLLFKFQILVVLLSCSPSAAGAEDEDAGKAASFLRTLRASLAH